MSIDLKACLPAPLQTADTRLIPVAVGQSGAGVFRVEAPTGVSVLKVTPVEEPLEAWQRAVAVQQAAAEVGFAPPILHIDATRRAVLSAHVTDRSFPAFYGNPATRAPALALLATTLRGIHALPAPASAPPVSARAFLRRLWEAKGPQLPLPDSMSAGVRALLAEDEPPADRPPVLSHNDANTTNLIFDGERLLLLDWQTAALNDATYDLATCAVFLRMDRATCQQFLALYDADGSEASARTLPARFLYHRRVVAAITGTTFLQIAQSRGYVAELPATLEGVSTLTAVYGRLREGTLSTATAEGQWTLGMALVREALVPLA